MDGNSSPRGRHRHRATPGRPARVDESPQWSPSTDRPQWTPPVAPQRTGPEWTAQQARAEQWIGQQAASPEWTSQQAAVPEWTSRQAASPDRNDQFCCVMRLISTSRRTPIDRLRSNCPRGAKKCLG